MNLDAGDVVRKMVLIVDDSVFVRHALCELFKRQADFEVCGVAENGREAIEAAGRLHPDLIVLDLSMPVMNGFEAARILSKLMPAVPLILFTSFQTFNLEQEALAAGISRLIVKSGPLADLVNCVRTLAKDAA